MFSSHFSCFSLNVRGLRDLNKRKAVFLFCKSKKRDIYFLQETHSCVNENSGVPSGGARFLSVITPARQVGLLYYIIVDLKEKL